MSCVALSFTSDGIRKACIPAPEYMGKHTPLSSKWGLGPARAAVLTAFAKLHARSGELRIS